MQLAGTVLNSTEGLSNKASHPLNLDYKADINTDYRSNEVRSSKQNMNNQWASHTAGSAASAQISNHIQNIGDAKYSQNNSDYPMNEAIATEAA